MTVLRLTVAHAVKQWRKPQRRDTSPGLAPFTGTACGGVRVGALDRSEWETLMKIPTVRAGAHIEGVHWIAEYAEDVHEIRIFREGQEIDAMTRLRRCSATRRTRARKSTADHRAVEAAVLAYLAALRGGARRGGIAAEAEAEADADACLLAGPQLFRQPASERLHARAVDVAIRRHHALAVLQTGTRRRKRPSSTDCPARR